MKNEFVGNFNAAVKWLRGVWQMTYRQALDSLALCREGRPQPLSTGTLYARSDKQYELLTD